MYTNLILVKYRSIYFCITLLFLLSFCTIIIHSVSNYVTNPTYIVILILYLLIKLRKERRASIYFQSLLYITFYILSLYFFQISFKFTTKLGGRQRLPIYSLSLHMYSLPHYHHPLQGGTSVITDEPTRTHHYHQSPQCSFLLMLCFRDLCEKYIWIDLPSFSSAVYSLIMLVYYNLWNHVPIDAFIVSNSLLLKDFMNILAYISQCTRSFVRIDSQK